MKSIIVADDSSVIINIVKRAFEDKYNILCAKNGAEAIEIIKNNDTNDIVGMLLDLNMPGVDGFAVLDYLKYNNLFNRVPVSIITGDDDMEIINKAFGYNIIDVLKKPFTVDSVTKIIDKTISLSSVNNI